MQRGEWAAKTVQRTPQPPAQTPSAPITGPRQRRNHTSRNTGRSGRPESSNPTQHAKGRTGDCPGPRKETATQWNVTRGGGPLGVSKGRAAGPSPVHFFPERRPLPLQNQGCVAARRQHPATVAGRCRTPVRARGIGARAHSVSSQKAPREHAPPASLPRALTR